MGDEGDEQLVLGAREVDPDPLASDPLLGEVDLDVAEAQQRLPGVGRGDPAQGGPHPGEQLLHVERLDDVVVGAPVEGGDLLGLRVPDRQHDHGLLGEGAQPGQHLEAVEVGQPEVQDDEVDAVGAQDPERRRAVAGGQHVIAAGLQARAEGAHDLAVVLDDEHSQAVPLPAS